MFCTYWQVSPALESRTILRVLSNGPQSANHRSPGLRRCIISLELRVALWRQSYIRRDKTPPYLPPPPTCSSMLGIVLNRKINLHRIGEHVGSRRRSRSRWEDNINLLQPTCYVMNQQFNIQQLYALPTLYLCVLCLSENKQRLVPLTA